MSLPSFRAPAQAVTQYDRDLRVALHRQFGLVGEALSSLLLAIGYVGASDTEPTTPGAVGDYVRNLDRTPLGGSGYEYVLDGWEYTTAGWRERRLLTGE